MDGITQGLDVTIKYYPRKANVVVDALIQKNNKYG